jgi:hypothetical protein
MFSAPGFERDSLHLSSGQNEILRVRNNLILPEYSSNYALGMVEFARTSGWLTDYRRAWKENPSLVDYGILTGDRLVLKVDDFEEGLDYALFYPDADHRMKARIRTLGLVHNNTLLHRSFTDTVIYECLSQPEARLLSA